MFWLNQLRKLLSALNANTSAAQLSAGFALGAVVGLLPKLNLLVLILCGVIVCLQVNISMAFLGALVFALIGSAVDPLTERVGFWLLAESEPLRPLWATLYGLPIVPFTGFNHTDVLGNLVLGAALFAPLFFGVRRGVELYRERLRERVLSWRVVQWLTATNLYDVLARWGRR